MLTASARHWIGRLVIWIMLGTLLTGCAWTFRSEEDLAWWARVGFRPDEPSVVVGDPDADVCKPLQRFIYYARDLKEAYRSRATQNRTWIYVAGFTGLSVAAASGALAAASAVAAGTLALLAISGGFTAAAFATIDNSELANVYTVAANDIGTALANVEAWPARCQPDKGCKDRLAYLTTAISNARNTLETARTASAAGALARATAQKTLLEQEIGKVQAEAKAKAKEEEAAKKQSEADTAKRQGNTAEEKELLKDADKLKGEAKAIRAQADTDCPDPNKRLSAPPR